MTIKIRVVPNASKDEVISLGSNSFKVKVTVSPERGKANAAVIKLLSKHFGVRKSQIAIIAGDRSRTKTLTIEGM